MNDRDGFESILEVEKRTADLTKDQLSLHGVRCAAHTLQLGIKDTISKKKVRLPSDTCTQYVEEVDTAIAVVSKLRTTKMKTALEDANLPMAATCIEVRWSSANTMVNV